MQGQSMYDFCGKIFPHFRSLTGEGVRATLHDIISSFTVDGGGGSRNQLHAQARSAAQGLCVRSSAENNTVCAL